MKDCNLLDRHENGIGWKCVRSDYTDFYSGTIKHSVGKRIEVTGPRGTKLCQPGVLHIAPTLRKAIYASKYIDNATDNYPWRFFNVRYDTSDVIDEDEEKIGVASYVVEQEYTLDDIFGADYLQLIEKIRTEIDSWKSIPWLKPEREITVDIVQSKIDQWHDALEPFFAQINLKEKIPRRVVIIPDLEQAIAVSNSWFNAADVDNVAAAAAETAAVAINADTDTDATYTVAAAATNVATADSIYAAVNAADNAAYQLFTRWSSWYLQPRYVLWYMVRWQIVMSTPNPWKPLIELYRLGVAPIGYRWFDGEVVFAVYVPDTTCAKIEGANLRE